MQLETQRLLLRRWQESDFEDFARINADPRVMEFFSKLLSPAEARAVIERLVAHFDKEGFGIFCAELKETKKCIGFIGMQVPSFETHFTPCVEIGWRLAYEVWGRGLAVEGPRECWNGLLAILE